jgi:hypothetical protein
MGLPGKGSRRVLRSLRHLTLTFLMGLCLFAAYRLGLPQSDSFPASTNFASVHFYPSASDGEGLWTLFWSHTLDSTDGSLSGTMQLQTVRVNPGDKVLDDEIGYTYVAFPRNIARWLTNCNGLQQVERLPSEHRLIFEGTTSRNKAEEYQLFRTKSFYCILDSNTFSSITSTTFRFAAPEITVSWNERTSPGYRKFTSGLDKGLPDMLQYVYDEGGDWRVESTRAYRGVVESRPEEGYVSWKGQFQNSGATLADGRKARYSSVVLGPSSLLATSPTGERDESRRLFYSAVLIGLASSCFLLLFEWLPWPRHSRARDDTDVDKRTGPPDGPAGVQQSSDLPGPLATVLVVVLIVLVGRRRR